MLYYSHGKGRTYRERERKTMTDMWFLNAESNDMDYEELIALEAEIAEEEAEQ